VTLNGIKDKTEGRNALEETQLDYAISSALTATKLLLCCANLKKKRKILVFF